MRLFAPVFNAHIRLRNVIQLLIFAATCTLAVNALPNSLVKADEAMTSLSVEGSSFTVNGKPTFLLGISYYGGLGASEDFIRSGRPGQRVAEHRPCIIVPQRSNGKNE